MYIKNSFLRLSFRVRQGQGFALDKNNLYCHTLNAKFSKEAEKCASFVIPGEAV